MASPVPAEASLIHAQMQTLWRVRPADPMRAKALATALDLDPVTAQLLLHRGVTDGASANRFLHPRLNGLADPEELPDLSRAMARLRQAIARREPILIFGDSDVDGLTASVILYEVLKALGAIVHARQANRLMDGYGLPERVIQFACRASIKILILVDCGTNQAEAVRELAAHGIETIIVDHHVPLEGFAQPYALINPHGDAGGRCRELSSAGLAFKVAQAFFQDGAQERLMAYLDLAALGILADYMPLRQEARVIVSVGLRHLVQSLRPGLRRLCEATRTSAPEPAQVLRRLVPRLNACGRLGDAAAAWRLLLRGDAHRVDTCFAEAEAAHARLKRLYRQVFSEAEEHVSRLHFGEELVIVVSRSGWPQGLMGPLASSLAQRYGRPAIAIALGASRGVGSGRSEASFNLLEALQACREALVQFGGHAQACGLTIERTQLKRFRELINERAKLMMGRQGLRPMRTADLEMPLGRVQPQWVEEMERFAPYGHGNDRPTAVIRHLTIEPRSSRTAVLSDGTIRLVGRGRWATLASCDRHDVIASPALVGREVVLTVSDVRGSTGPSEPAQTSGTTYRRGLA